MILPPASDELRQRLDGGELRAVRALVWKVLEEAPAELVEAALFGSHARGTARPDSDVDLLLIFARLPPDREPHSSIAEQLADEMAVRTGVPLTVWTVSLEDTLEGSRTPMLVDALEDAIPVWSYPRPLPPLFFTPPDALRCCKSLLERLDEGSEEVAARIRQGDVQAAARRARDDLVRLCTALLLLRGTTRPRRGNAVRLARRLLGALPGDLQIALDWAESSFGPTGRADQAELTPPPCGLPGVARAIGHLRRKALEDYRGLADRAEPGGRGWL